MAYRDISIPYTEEEVVGLRQSFRSMPTYKDGFVSHEDVPELFEKIRYERTPEQLRKIQEFWLENWDGKIKEETYINLANTNYKASGFARQLVIEVDANNDGYISEEEFQSVFKYLNKHDSTFSGKAFQDFVSEADTNKDGRVDVEECVAWLQKQYVN